MLLIFRGALNETAARDDKCRGACSGTDPRQWCMKIALLALLGAILGSLGGAAIGIVIGIAWVGIFKTDGSEAVLVFFIFMPCGAIAGAAFGGVAFGLMAARDAEISISQEHTGRSDR
jgi:hypothetical protein